jgi:hypothetical protein
MAEVAIPRNLFADILRMIAELRSIRDYLLAIAIFANGAEGHSALQLSRDLACQYMSGPSRIRPPTLNHIRFIRFNFFPDGH